MCKRFFVAQKVEQRTVNLLVEVQFLAGKKISMHLKLLFIIPLLSIIIIPFISLKKVKLLSLFTSILIFLYTVYLAIIFDNSSSFQFLTNINILNTNINLGCDGISLIYILLTSFIFPICILVSYNSINTNIKLFFISLLSIEFFLFGVFTILDLLGFYIFYEAILIPMILIIGIYGARKEKITAAYYFFFYTLIGSILMLLGIIYIYNITGTTDYLLLLGTDKFDFDVQLFLFLAFFSSFAVKIPKWPFHIWLPLAHVEAPLAGSILLAGILIKMGSYGLLRFVLPLFPDASIYFSPLVNTLAVIAIIYASLTTIRQTDLKRIIAYSSVSHMGVVILGLFSLTAIGIEGSIILQIAHGLVSSGLFIVVTLLYERHHTRIVKYYRGIAITMPLLAIIFVILTLANIGVPLTSNFIGEFLSLYGIFSSNIYLGILGSLGMVLSACYALFLLNRVIYADISPYVKASPYNRDLTRRELAILLPLVIMTLVLGLYPDYILNKIHVGVNIILTYIN
jgi:NADH-ubiquinone oxidoreductase chain 4